MEGFQVALGAHGQFVVGSARFRRAPVITRATASVIAVVAASAIVAVGTRAIVPRLVSTLRLPFVGIVVTPIAVAGTIAVFATGVVLLVRRPAAPLP